MRNRFSRLLLAGLAAGLISTPVLAQVLILKSTGANASRTYKAGSIIEEDSQIDLVKGDQIVLLFGQATRTFDGPGSITPAEVFTQNADAGAISALVDFLKSTDAETTELGAVRGTTELPSDPWVVNVTSPGIKCVIGGAPLILWRGMDIPGDLATLATADGHSLIEFEWPAGMSEAEWPEGFAVGEGDQLTIDYGLGENVEFHLREMPPGIVDNGARLVWLAQQGCTSQVEVLLGRL